LKTTRNFLDSSENRPKRPYGRFMGSTSEIREAQTGSPFLTVKDAAVELSCSEAHIRRLIDSGDLAGFRLGNGSRSPYRIPRSALDAYVAQRINSQTAALPSRSASTGTRRSGSSASWAMTYSTNSVLEEDRRG
jgi:excisionase family DNA binding protein